jgi:hypothetical protein
MFCALQKMFEPGTVLPGAQQNMFFQKTVMPARFRYESLHKERIQHGRLAALRYSLARFVCLHSSKPNVVRILPP